MSLTASCISICVATTRSSVKTDLPGVGRAERHGLPRTGSHPGEEADGHDGAYPPGRTARVNQPGRHARADQPGEAAAAGLPDGPAKADPPDRAPETLRP